MTEPRTGCRRQMTTLVMPQILRGKCTYVNFLGLACSRASEGAGGVLHWARGMFRPLCSLPIGLECLPIVCVEIRSQGHGLESRSAAWPTDLHKHSNVNDSRNESLPTSRGFVYLTAAGTSNAF
jgi:hypothetical protein